MKSFKTYCLEQEAFSDGILVCNMTMDPSSPKASWMTPAMLYADLSKYFGAIKKIGGEVFVCMEKLANPSNCKDIEYTPDEVTTMGKTARPWKSTKTYNVALSLIRKGDRVLDFGSGKFQNVKPYVEQRGGIYVPYDTAVQGINNPSILQQKYDLVMGSNVLNVQGKLDQQKALDAYYSTLCKLVRAVK